MGNITKLLILVAFIFGSCYAQQCSAPAVSQIRRGDAWEKDGVQYSAWEARITAGSNHITSLALGLNLPFDSEIVDLWELDPTTYNPAIAETYKLPAWMNANPLIPGDKGGLAPGAIHNFGYILSSHSPAEVVITEVSCDGLPSITPSAILCNSTFHTECFTLAATRGTGENICYNFGSFFENRLSSFLYFGTEEAFRAEVFADFDCLGSPFISATPGPYKLENTANNNIGSSIRFVPKIPTQAVFCNEPLLEECTSILSTNGLNACYSFDSAFDKQVTSFQLFSNDDKANGFTFYEGSNCDGESWINSFGEATNGVVYELDAEFNNRASSFKFNAV